MSIQRHGDGLFWSSLFSVSDGISKKQLLNLIQTWNIDYNGQSFATKMLEISGLHSRNYVNYAEDEPCMIKACEHVALKFMLCDSDLANDLLSEEEREKALALYARKQYNSKLLKDLLCKFWILLNEQFPNRYGEVNIFTIPIIDEFRKVQEDEINRSYEQLKKIIEKVASGVKNNCYRNAELISFFNDDRTPLNDELNQFLFKRTNYDFNKAIERGSDSQSIVIYYNRVKNNSSALQTSINNNNILQLALVNDESFWSKHNNFNIISFLNEIVEENDIRHAEKVLSFIFDNLQKMPNMNLVIKNNFPLYMSKYNELVESLEDQTFRFSFKRLESYCDLSKVKSVPLCYPMSKAEPSFFEIGKKVWERFISKYNYPNDYDIVNRYISDEINQFVAGDKHNYDDIAVILDSASFHYSADSEDRRLFSAYHPDCFSFENIWNRVYLKAYCVTLLSDDEQKQFSYLQRIFVDLIKTIEKRIKICTVHQLDTTTRDKHYSNLKKLLKTYGIEVNDEHKSNYIISLLDRDTAMIEEAKAFPMLEQIGDAIYGLAVAELLFYNPDNLFYPMNNYDPDGKNIAERFEKFTRAEAQVLISKKHKIDELYLQTGLPAKFTEYDSIFFDYDTLNEEQLQALNKEKYIADSLEMIIGTIFIDKGINHALNFAKQLLRKTYPKDFSKEIHIEDKNRLDENIDRDYWSRILPGLYSDMSDAHRVIWDALNKVILIASLGTDDKEKRRYITNSFGNTAIYGEEYYYGISWPLYYYLHNGLDSVLQKYRDVIRGNYTKKDNKF